MDNGFTPSDRDALTRLLVEIAYLKEDLKDQREISKQQGESLKTLEAWRWYVLGMSAVVVFLVKYFFKI